MFQSAGVDSDASPEMVSDSDAEPVEAENPCADFIFQLQKPMDFYHGSTIRIYIMYMYIYIYYVYVYISTYFAQNMRVVGHETAKNEMMQGFTAEKLRILPTHSKNWRI